MARDTRVLVVEGFGWLRVWLVEGLASGGAWLVEGFGWWGLADGGWQM